MYQRILASLLLGVLYTFHAVAQPTNNDFANAIDVTTLINSCSADAAYTTIGATGDLNGGSCHNVQGGAPGFNVWFSITAPVTGEINITIDRGGSKGTQTYTQATIWDATGLVEIACKRYQVTTEDVIVGATALTPGATYYITVDTYNTNTDGTFTLCLADQVDYDYYEGAIDITSLINSCSADAAYSTIGATGDRNEGSCHNVQGGGPKFNRWFSFTAPASGFINITIDRGGSKGSQTYTQAAIWDATGLVEIACKRYQVTTEDVVIGATTLTPGATYYLTVDTYNTNTDGTFTLCLSDAVDYDYYEGAIDITSLINSCSADAAYTTIGATGDRNEGSCHNVQGGGPKFNRWFSFTAPASGFINITIDRGGSKGTQTYTQAAIWDATGLVEIACKRYQVTTEDVVIGATTLTPGATYYLTVDTYNTNTDGTFTLCLSDQVDYDYYEGAVDITSLINGCSADAAYTTIGATGDRNEGSCHNVQGGGPKFNRWFYFTAPVSGRINITVDRGGGKGSQTYTQAAIWEVDGLTEVACKRYQVTTEDVVIGATTLTPGATYYLTIDTYNTNTDGTFTLCLDDQVDYDYYEGALDVTSLINGCSADAAYTTIGATGDRNEGSCHNVQGGGPKFNRWFYFTAPASGRINVTVDRGGGKGSQTYTQAAIWESDGLTEVACKRYQVTTEDVIVGATALTPGATYYITVDTYNTNTDGTFTLCLSDQVDYDYYEGAILLPDINNWCSADAAYSTIGATGDRNEGSCHNVQGGGPRFNRWFYFVATSNFIDITVDRGGGKGSQTYTQIAIWESDGLTEVACKRYQVTTEDVKVGYTSLTPGNTYYITVDTYNTNTDGTFTLCVNDEPDYDFYEGALELSDLNNWCSADAAYTTIGATGDLNTGSCHNVQGGGPKFNRWFYFNAISNNVTITVDRGGSKGSQTYTQLALWEADGVTEVACQRYVATTDDVSIAYGALVVGNDYYISVDTYNTNTDGTFTLCIDNIDEIYYSRANGLWNNATSWSTVAIGGAAAPDYPQVGDIAYIEGYTISITGTSENAAEVNLNAATAATGLTLTASATLDVTGQFSVTNPGNSVNTSISLTNSVLNINDQLTINRNGGTATIDLTLNNSDLSINRNLEIYSTAGTNDNTIGLVNGSTLNVIEDALLSNAGGPKTFLNNDGSTLTFNQDLILTAAADDKIELGLTNAGLLNLKKDVVRGSPAYGILNAASGTTVSFNSANYLQSFPNSTGSGTGDTFNYQNVIVNNSRITTPQLTLDGAVIVNGSLTLTDGEVFTTSSNLLTLNSGASTSGASDASFIDGPIKKIGNTDFEFPVGNNNFWQPMAIENLTGDAATEFTAQYFVQQPLDYKNLKTSDPNGDLHNISGLEYWKLDNTGTVSDADITLFWKDQSRSEINDALDLQMARYTGVEWENLGQTNINFTDPGSISVAGINSFGPLTFGSLSGDFNPLPVELLYFNATPNLQNIAITWATASELENDYFILEHSGDGETWDEIGKIRGQGTTFTKHEYTFTDDFPIRGMQYYRLWQYDYNGDNELLDIALADHTGTEQFRIDLWPNPLSQRKLNIKTKNTSLIQNINVITSLGLRVEVPLKTLSSTEGYIELPLAADLYIIEIETNKGIIRRKIIKR